MRGMKYCDCLEVVVEWNTGMEYWNDQIWKNGNTAWDNEDR